MTVQERKEIYEIARDSFIEDRFIGSFERAMKEGGCGMCGRIVFFYYLVYEKEVECTPMLFPEIWSQEPEIKYGGFWIKLEDVETRIMWLREAINICNQKLAI